MNGKEKRVFIVAPSLDPNEALGGISSVASFIIKNNKDCHYIHFEQGKRDSAKNGAGRFIGLLYSYKKWVRFLKENHEAIIHYNFPLSPAAIIRDFFFMRKAKKMNMKMLVHVHGGLYMNTPRIPFLFRALLKKIYSWDIPFIVLSETEKSKLINFGAKDVHILANCVELDDCLIVRDSNHPLVLGYIGRITVAKGMTELLEACNQLLQRKVPFKMKIAGAEGENESYIEKFQKTLGDKFDYEGIVSGEVKRDFLRNIDVFVLPSYFEGLPVSLLESMSYGAVPVVTAVGSIPSVVKNEYNGILIEDHNVGSIVDAVIRVVNDDELRMKMSDLARKTIRERFSPQTYFEKLNQIYDSL